MRSSGRISRGARAARRWHRGPPEYEQRTNEDKDRLDAMVAYAQTTSCRVKCQKEYFRMQAAEHCGHCDNCRDRPAEQLVHEPAHAPEGPTLGHAPPPTGMDNGYAPGDRVKHRRFGTGEVLSVADARVVVAFVKHGEPTVARPYLKKVA